jgi:hypothetical protein
VKRAIHKFILKRGTQQVVSVPGYFSLLDIQIQRGELVMWCLVITEAESPRDLAPTMLDVTVLGTGFQFPDDVSYQAYRRTVQDVHELVWHIFVSERRVA